MSVRRHAPSAEHIIVMGRLNVHQLLLIGEEQGLVSFLLRLHLLLLRTNHYERKNQRIKKAKLRVNEPVTICFFERAL